MSVPEANEPKPEPRDAGKPAGQQPPVPRNPPPSADNDDRAIYYFALWIGITAIVAWVVLWAPVPTGATGLLLLLLFVAPTFAISFVAAAWLTKQLGVDVEVPGAARGLLFVVLFALFVFCLLLFLGLVCSTLDGGSY